MLSMSATLHPSWVSNSDRKRAVKIHGVNYELYLINAAKGRLMCHQLVAGTPRLMNTIEIPLTQPELNSLFDARTAADILRLASELRR